MKDNMKDKLKTNFIFLVLGFLFVFCVSQCVIVDYKAFHYNRRGVNICRRTLPYNVSPDVFIFSENRSGYLLDYELADTFKGCRSAEIVGYGYNDSMIIAMITDSLIHVHYYVSTDANFDPLVKNHGVKMKAISETVFQQYKSKCRWIYTDDNLGNSLSTKESNYFTGAIFILLLFLCIVFWRKNKASEDPFVEGKTLESQQFYHKVVRRQRITIYLPRIVFLISFFIFCLNINNLFDGGFKRIVENHPILTYCKSVEYPNTSYFKDKDSEPVLGEGNHYFRSDIKIDKMLGYGYNDTLLIVEYRDSLNRLHYLGSYQMQQIDDKAQHVIGFMPISEYTFNTLKISCQWVDLSTNRVKLYSEKITLIKFIALVMATVSIIFWFILLGQKKKKTYDLIFIAMLLVYVGIIFGALYLTV